MVLPIVLGIFALLCHQTTSRAARRNHSGVAKNTILQDPSAPHLHVITEPRSTTSPIDNQQYFYYDVSSNYIFDLHFINDALREPDREACLADGLGELDHEALARPNGYDGRIGNWMWQHTHSNVKFTLAGDLHSSLSLRDVQNVLLALRRFASRDGTSSWGYLFNVYHPDHDSPDGEPRVRGALTLAAREYASGPEGWQVTAATSSNSLKNITELS